MEKITNVFKKIWNAYRNWLGDVVWYKNWKVWLSVAIVFVVGMTGDSQTDDVEAEEPVVEEVAEIDEKPEKEVVDKDESVEEEAEETEENNLPEELQDLRVRDVRDDVTGNWRVVVDNKNFKMPENAVAYSDEYMNEDETHFLVSFTTYTTTIINDYSGVLYVDIKEYVKKEEHYADTLGNGMLLKSYQVVKETGEITELEEE